MKLIWLYGPPGVGKLTVAKELSGLTGYKVFHNHLTTDLVRSIFPREMKETGGLINKYRIELIELAAQKNINIIFTFVYAKKLDDAWVRMIVRRVKKYHGEVCFVNLVCSKQEIKKRIKHESRKGYTKIKSVKTLDAVFRRADVFSSVPYAENLVIDNTHLSPRIVARKIKEYYKL